MCESSVLGSGPDESNRLLLFLKCSLPKLWESSYHWLRRSTYKGMTALLQQHRDPWHNLVVSLCHAKFSFRSSWRNKTISAQIFLDSPAVSTSVAVALRCLMVVICITSRVRIMIHAVGDTIWEKNRKNLASKRGFFPSSFRRSFALKRRERKKYISLLALEQTNARSDEFQRYPLAACLKRLRHLGRRRRRPQSAIVRASNFGAFSQKHQYARAEREEITRFTQRMCDPTTYHASSSTRVWSRGKKELINFLPPLAWRELSVIISSSSRKGE